LSRRRQRPISPKTSARTRCEAWLLSSGDEQIDRKNSRTPFGCLPRQALRIGQVKHGVIAKVTVEPGYFKYAVGRHFVFYRLGEERLDVIRILHNQMDIEARLED
jgi:hypothetical protein